MPSLSTINNHNTKVIDLRIRAIHLFQSRWKLQFWQYCLSMGSCLKSLQCCYDDARTSNREALLGSRKPNSTHEKYIVFLNENCLYFLQLEFKSYITISQSNMFQNQIPMQLKWSKEAPHSVSAVHTVQNNIQTWHVRPAQ